MSVDHSFVGPIFLAPTFPLYYFCKCLYFVRCWHIITVSYIPRSYVFGHYLRDFVPLFSDDGEGATAARAAGAGAAVAVATTTSTTTGTIYFWLYSRHYTLQCLPVHSICCSTCSEYWLGLQAWNQVICAVVVTVVCILLCRSPAYVDSIWTNATFSVWIVWEELLQQMYSTVGMGVGQQTACSMATSIWCETYTDGNLPTAPCLV